MSTRTMPNSTTLGHVITVCQPSDGRRRELPPLTIGGLALELAGMIRDALPAALVCIVRVDLRPTEREQAEQQTHAIKRQVIEAREAEQARDLIALHRDGKIGVMRCTFDADNGDLFENLAELQQSARRFIACLRAKSLASKSEEDA